MHTWRRESPLIRADGIYRTLLKTLSSYSLEVKITAWRWQMTHFSDTLGGAQTGLFVIMYVETTWVVAFTSSSRYHRPTVGWPAVQWRYYYWWINMYIIGSITINRCSITGRVPDITSTVFSAVCTVVSTLGSDGMAEGHMRELQWRGGWERDSGSVGPGSVIYTVADWNLFPAGVWS